MGDKIMNKLLNDAFKRIYINKDYQYFINKCEDKLDFSGEFNSKVRTYVKDVIEENIKGFPSQRWYFTFDHYENGEFKASYRTLLQISKIVPIFYVQHEFEVENYDSNKMCPVLDGFGTEPYIKNQAILHEIIKEYLESAGYFEIDYSQINEVIINVENNSFNIIKGEKYTVEDLMFNDMLDLGNTING